MRKGVIGLVVLFSFSLFPAFSATPPKAGSVCSKQGLTKTYQGKKFTCVKSSKKLVWNKGVAIKKASPTPTPTPSPSPSPTLTRTQSPTPTPTPTIPAENPALPTSFDDLEKNFKGIPYAVWQEIQKNLSLHPSTTLRISFLFGPNTPKRYPDEWTIDAVTLGSRVMGNQKQPLEVKFVQYNKTDVNWARTEAAKYVSPFRLGISFADQASEKCAGTDCDGAVTNLTTDVGLVLVGVSNPVNRFNIQRFLGQNDLHEYTHAVQGMIFKGKTQPPPPVLMPCWYSEGQPQAVSIPTMAKSVDDYVNIRKGWIIESRYLLKDYEPETIQDFLSKNMKLPCDSNSSAMVYSLGYVVMDALVAIGGIDKTFDLLIGIADGMTFEDSFKKVYGTSWTIASVAISKAVSKVYKEYRT